MGFPALRSTSAAPRVGRTSARSTKVERRRSTIPCRNRTPTSTASSLRPYPRTAGRSARSMTAWMPHFACKASGRPPPRLATHSHHSALGQWTTSAMKRTRPPRRLRFQLPTAATARSPTPFPPLRRPMACPGIQRLAPYPGRRLTLRSLPHTRGRLWTPTVTRPPYPSPSRSLTPSLHPVRPIPRLPNRLRLPRRILCLLLGARLCIL